MTLTAPETPKTAPASAGDDVHQGAYELLSTVPAGHGGSGGGLRLSSTLPSAIEALRANKGRSLLTALGIIIGVAAVIAVVALGEGASSSVNARLSGLGTNILTVFSGSTFGGGVRGGAGTAQTLTLQDATNVAQIPHVAAVSPVVQGNAQVIAGSRNWQTRITGVTPDYQTLENWDVQSGSFLTNQDEQSARNVAVLGQTVVENLFPNGQNPVGQVVRIRNVPFIVEGTLQAKGVAGFGPDQDDVVMIPFRTAQVRLFGNQALNNIIVGVDSANNMDDVTQQMTTVLREDHNLGPRQAPDFQIRNNNDLISRVQGVSQTLTLLLSGVAAVSLIVGGIGIMNIMLVSVTERTREIGIRTAIGAQPRDILLQFLIEALVLSLLGGLLGILIGAGIAFALPKVAGWATTLPAGAIFLAFGFSAFVGVFFGIYPARKASQLDPIEALRYQ